MTVVQHTLVDAAGTALQGVQVAVRLVNNGYISSGTKEIIASKTTTTDANGLYSFDLTPNASIDPAGTHYEVSHPGNETLSFIVAGTGPLQLRNLLVVNPAAPNLVTVGAAGYQMPAPGGTDDTALFTAAEAALPSTGGTIWLQAGAYMLPGGYAFTKPVRLVGQGMGDPYGYQPGPGFPLAYNVRGITTVLCSSLTANAIQLGGQGSTVSDLAIVNTNTGTQTAGAGINVTGGNLTRLTRVGIANFYDNVVYTDGELLVMRDCFTVEAVRYHVRYSNTTVVDGGDAEIHGCSFYQVTRTATAGFFWQSGGGPRIQGNKFNCVANKITSAVSFDPLGTTTVIKVENNSIENCLVGINFNRTSGTASIGQVQIANNEFGNHQYGILVQSAGFSLMDITDNIIKACTTTGISLANTANVHVGANHHNTYTSSSYPITVASTCTNIGVDPQWVDTGNVYTNSTTAVQGGAAFDNRFIQALPVIGTTNTTLWRLGVAIVTAGTFEFTLAGQLVGVGQFMHTGVRSFTRGASGAVTVASIGTDTTIGTTADWTLTFDTATVAGEIQVKLLRTTATAIIGQMELDVHGPLGTVRIGA